jgi:hypothetical protein
LDFVKKLAVTDKTAAIEKAGARTQGHQLKLDNAAPMLPITEETAPAITVFFLFMENKEKRSYF